MAAVALELAAAYARRMGARKRARSKPLGRSFLAGEVTLEEVRKLTKAWNDAAPLFDDEMMDGSIYDVQVVDGDLHVKGDLRTFEHELCGLVVTGDLTVDGLYAETDDPACGVFVLGDMKAARVVTNGTLGVKGTLTATEACVGFYNDYGASIGKDLVTPLFAPENHHFDIKGKLRASHVVGYGAEYRVPKAMKAAAEKLMPKRLSDLLVPDVLEGEDGDDEQAELDNTKLRERVRAGKPVLKAPPPARAKARAQTKTSPKKASARKR